MNAWTIGKATLDSLILFHHYGSRRFLSRSHFSSSGIFSTRISSMTTSDYSTKSANRKHCRRTRVSKFFGQAPTAIEDLPRHLQGESQNKFGGSNSTFVKAGSFYSKRGKCAATVHTLSQEQYDQIKEHAEKSDFTFGSASSLRNTRSNRRRRGQHSSDRDD